MLFVTKKVTIPGRPPLYLVYPADVTIGLVGGRYIGYIDPRVNAPVPPTGTFSPPIDLFDPYLGIPSYIAGDYIMTVPVIMAFFFTEKEKRLIILSGDTYNNYTVSDSYQIDYGNYFTNRYTQRFVGILRNMDVINKPDGYQFWFE